MLSKQIIENVLYAALETGADFADIFIEDRVSTNIELAGGFVKEAISGRDYGVGIRLLKDDFTVYGFTNDASEENLLKVTNSLAAAMKNKRMIYTIDLRKSILENKHTVTPLPNTIAKNKKVEWMKQAYQAATDYDSEITQTIVHYSDHIQEVLIANTEGLLIEDIRTRHQMNIDAVASNNTSMESANIGLGSAGSIDYMENADIAWHGREAARSAKTKLHAAYAPAGKFPVVIDNAFGGVIFHEACGHGLESASVAKNASVFANKIGENVASPLVTAYDDGTIPNRWGSLHIDDEGMPTQKNLLIENGILRGYLIDRVGSRKMNLPPTGSGRRESYHYAPTSRMNNTYIAAGDSTPEEIISNTEYGIFAKYLEGGSVNPSTSDFNFSVSEGYIIRDGKIAEPIKGATLIGKGIDILRKVDMVGNNLELGRGMCGASSGTIPVTVGQPTIRVAEMIVGGRKE